MERYPKEKELGRGEYGSVYASTREGRRYAVKVQKERFDMGTTMSSLKEAAYLIALNGHRNVVGIVDAGLTDDGAYMTMPMADATLKDLLPLVDLSMAVDCLYQLVLGLAHVHDNNIIHRDLKPQNILATLEPNGRFNYKIADFGLSHGNACYDDKRLSNKVVSLGYRAPEIALQGKYSFKSDVWSLGCVFYEILTGQPLFPSQDEHGLMAEFVKKLGPIDLAEWPDAVNYPEYDTIRKLVFPTKKDWKSSVHPVARSVLEAMLTYNPAARASLGKVLSDPLFDESKRRDGIDPKDDAIGVRSCEDMVSDRLFPLNAVRYARIFGSFEPRNLVAVQKWILRACDRISSSDFTKALALSYFYWYLSEDCDKKGQMALTVAAACVSLASKMNEDYLFYLEDIFASTDKPMGKEIRETEREVVRCLGFDLYRTTVVSLVSVLARFYSTAVGSRAMRYGLLSCLTVVPFELPVRDVALAAIRLACDVCNEEFKHSADQIRELAEHTTFELQRSLKDLRDRDPGGFVGEALKDI